MKLEGRKLDGVHVVLVPFLELPGELLHEPRDGRARDVRRLHAASTGPRSCTEGHGLVHVCNVKLATIQEPLWLPFLRFVPVVPVHVAAVQVDDHLAN